jgi:hypothetical protein
MTATYHTVAEVDRALKFMSLDLASYRARGMQTAELVATDRIDQLLEIRSALSRAAS